MITDKEREMLRALKSQKNLTNKKISDLTGIPEPTISNIFNKQGATTSWSNIREIVRAMGGSLDELAGIKAVPIPVIQKEDDSKLISLYERGIAFKNKVILILSVLCLLLIAVVAIVLIYDIMHPHLGYIKG